MSTDPAEAKTFVVSWLLKVKADASLNQHMVDLLADHHANGTSSDENILTSLLTLANKPEVPDGVH
ncbi:MAG TPA: hypothetical protein VGN12_25445 [Pirellulales bacterium]|jgi:hypothetical protein